MNIVYGRRTGQIINSKKFAHIYNAIYPHELILIGYIVWLYEDYGSYNQGAHLSKTTKSVHI